MNTDKFTEVVYLPGTQSHIDALAYAQIPDTIHCGWVIMVYFTYKIGIRNQSTTILA
jgi:hypothetical protein